MALVWSAFCKFGIERTEIIEALVYLHDGHNGYLLSHFEEVRYILNSIDFFDDWAVYIWEKGAIEALSLAILVWEGERFVGVALFSGDSLLLHSFDACIDIFKRGFMADVGFAFRAVQNMLGRKLQLLLLVKTHRVSNNLSHFLGPSIARTNPLNLKPVIRISRYITLRTQIVIRRQSQDGACQDEQAQHFLHDR